VLQEYAASASTSWTPGSAGTYHVQVWVRSAGSTLDYDAWGNSSPYVVSALGLTPPGSVW
jgi:hypothetical protein